MPDVIGKALGAKISMTPLIRWWWWSRHTISLQLSYIVSHFSQGSVVTDLRRGGNFNCSLLCSSFL